MRNWLKDYPPWRAFARRFSREECASATCGCPRARNNLTVTARRTPAPERDRPHRASDCTGPADSG
jgi:hypothetical protein